MPEDELREKMQNEIVKYMKAWVNDKWEYPVPQLTDQILALIREAGYIQPKFLKDLLKDMQIKWMKQIKEAGWKSPEEVSDKHKDTIDSIIAYLPDGWPMPLGFDELIAQLLNEKGEPK